MIYFQGAHIESILDAYLKVGVKNIGVDYFYLRSRSEDALISLLQTIEERELNVFLDSGSYSIRKDKGFSEEEIQEYFDNYLQFVGTYKQYFSLIRELDLQGISDTYSRREQLLSCVDDKLLVVLHEDFDPTEYEVWDKIGLLKQKSAPDYIRLQNLFSDREGVQFHAIGFTDTQILQTVKFASLDTYSPQYGGRFKAVFRYADSFNLKRVSDSNMSDIKRKKILKRLAPKAVELGLDREKFVNEEAFELNAWNTYQWLQLDAFLGHRQELALAVREPMSLSTVQDPHVSKGELAKFSNDPKFQIKRECNSCIYNDMCPVFESNSQCKLDQHIMINSHDDVLEGFKHLLSLQMNRVGFAAMIERLNGGGIEAETSELMESSARMFEAYRRSMASTHKLAIEASGDGVGLLQALVLNLQDGATPGNNGQSHTARRAAELRKREAIKEVLQETESRGDDILDADFSEVTEDGDTN